MSVAEKVSRRAALGTTVAGLGGLAVLAVAPPATAGPATAGPAPSRRWPDPVRSWVFTESTYYQGFRAARLHRLTGRNGRFYTMNAGEAAYAAEYDGYRDDPGETQLWVIPVTDPAKALDGSAQLLRLWNTRRQRQLRTCSEPVAQYAVRYLGYRLEAEHPAPYVFTARVGPKAVPYRFEHLRLPV